MNAPALNGASSSNLIIVFENPGDLNNVERIMRTCKVFGLPELRVVSPPAEDGARYRKELELSGFAADSSIELNIFDSTRTCITDLEAGGYMSIATALEQSSVDIYTLDLSKSPKVAVWVGEEKRGLSKEALSAASTSAFIPMFGMAQSLNVGISAAIAMSEYIRQQSFLGPQGWQLPSHISCKAAIHAGEEAAAQVQIELPPGLSRARMDKFAAVAKQRQRGIVVVLVDPDRKDAAAVQRSCDAFGVSEVHIVFVKDKPFDPLAKRQVHKSEGSNLWVCSRTFLSVAACEEHLERDGHTSVDVTDTASNVVPLFESPLPLLDHVAFWFGHDRLCDEQRSAKTHASLCIPTVPGTEGLFITTSVSIVLAETVRQRRSHPSLDRWSVSQAEQSRIIHWCVAVHLQRHPNIANGGYAAAVDPALAPEYQSLGHLREELARQGW